MENLSFEEALRNADDRYKSNQEMTPASRYKEIGLYYKMVKDFQQGFKDLHIIIYDDYLNDLKLVLKKVFSFLEIEDIEIDTSKRYMVGGWQWTNEKIKKLIVPKSNLKSILKFLLPEGIRRYIRANLMQLHTKKIEEMGVGTRKYLRDYYLEDVKDLSLLLDRNLNNWTK